MILSRNIPLNVPTFLNNVQRDHRAGLVSGDYRALLIRETRIRYPGLVEGLADPGRTRRGQPRVIADADHIVPQSLWQILIPLAWNLAGPAPPTPHILSNLFWRTVAFNRGAVTRGEALDQPYIRMFQMEAKTTASAQWAQSKIQFFLRTKHDEGVNIDVPVDPRRVDRMIAGNDVSDAMAFVQRLKHERPGISPNEIAALVEEKFPHILIDTEGNVPRIEIG